MATSNGTRSRPHRAAPLLAGCEAEISVLGGALIDADAAARAMVLLPNEQSFGTEKHRLVWRAMLRLHAQASPIDPVTLSEHLDEAGDLAAVGGMQFIGELLDAVPTAANIDYHAAIVRAQSFARAVAAAAAEPGTLRDKLVHVEQALDAARTQAARSLTVLTDEQIARLPQPEWVVEDLIPEGACAVVFGPPGAGKSFVAVALALSVGTGRRFIGKSVRRGPVIYVAPEGAAGLGARVAAWKEHCRHGGVADVHFIPAVVNLLDAADVTAFIAAVRPLKPVVVVIDTLARSIPGGDENSARDMGLAIQQVDRIRAVLGAAVVLIHHTNKNGQQERGSTALRGAADAMVSVQLQDSGLIAIACETMKDAPPFATFQAALKSVGASAVVTADWQAAVTADFLTPNQHRALKSLRDGFHEDGATASQWVKASGLAERSFYEIRTWLDNKGYVARDKKGRGARYSLTEQGHKLFAAVTAGNCKVTACSDGGSLPAAPHPFRGGAATAATPPTDSEPDFVGDMPQTRQNG